MIKNFALQRINIPLLISIVLMSGCGNNKEETTDLTEPEKRVFSSFEGESMDIVVGQQNTKLSWIQTQGPAVTIQSKGNNVYNISVPWIMTENDNAEFNVIDDGKVIQHIHLDIKNRHFLLFRVENSDTNQESLYLNYVAGEKTEEVPTLDTVLLANAPVGHKICFFATSPNGQYIAYSTTDEEFLFGAGSCYGLYIVDIEKQTTTKISPLDDTNNDIKTLFPQWSPDSNKIAYRGIFGEATLSQHYVYDIRSKSTSYLNYANNNLASDQWPLQDLYPVSDGGNPYLGDSEIPNTTKLTWLNNSTSVGFVVTDPDTYNSQPYIASIHGDARQLIRPSTVADYFLTLLKVDLDELYNNLLPCPSSGCINVVQVNPLIVPQYEVTKPIYSNPYLLSTSIEGNFSFLASIQLNDDGIKKVLAVSPKIREGEPINPQLLSRIVSEDVFDAAWSPTKMQLAFAGETKVRYRYDKDFSELNNHYIDLLGSEIPGQLYLYDEYQIDTQITQGRLSYPQPEIDDNYVRKLKWSNSGDYIAYVRGEDGSEGDYFTSLWVTSVDDRVLDESNATIDSHTTLLENLRDNSDYMVDFIWQPKDAGVLAMIKNISTIDGSLLSLTMRYFPRDGSPAIDFATLNSKAKKHFSHLGLVFSPNGRYFAYKDSESKEDGAKTAIFIQSIAGGAPVKVKIPSDKSPSWEKPFWSIKGNKLILSANAEFEDYTHYFEASVDGKVQSLHKTFQSEQKILQLSNDSNSHINLNF